MSSEGMRVNVGSVERRSSPPVVCVLRRHTATTVTTGNSRTCWSLEMENNAAVNLPNGKTMPLVGFGTWLITEGDIGAALNCALEAGYRHIDTAYLYQNEDAIGDVLGEWIGSGRVRREELFISTKLPFIGNKPEKVEHFLKLSLESLKLDYVDLYLIHLPVGFIGKHDKDLYPQDENRRAVLDLNTDLIALWRAMEAQMDAGRVKAIGLSNFNSQQIERIVRASRIAPANLQIELHAYLQQKPLLAVCRKYGIPVCAYATLGSSGRIEYYAKRGVPPPKIPAVLEDSVVLAIARARDKTPAQVLLRHLLQQGIVVIPKSITPQRIQENIKVFDFTLSDDEMEQLSNIDRNYRSFTFEVALGVTDHPEYPFHLTY